MPIKYREIADPSVIWEELPNGNFKKVGSSFNAVVDAPYIHFLEINNLIEKI